MPETKKPSGGIKSIQWKEWLAPIRSHKIDSTQ